MHVEITTPATAGETGMFSSRLRWTILALLSISITVNLIDRQVLSVVAPLLRDQLHLSNTGYAYIVFAFQLGMFLGQIPAGMLLDRVGTRIGLALILSTWSVFNGLHALARTVKSFLILRLGMGISECGNYSGGVKALAAIFPAEQRALASGIFNAGAQLGSVVAPPLIVLITLRFGWPAAFLLPSILGAVWILPWLRIFPKVRRQASIAGTAAAPAASGVPLRVLLRNRQVMGMLVWRMFNGPLTSFFWYWLPEYFRHARGMSFVLIGMLAWIPYLFGTLGNLGGGFVSDWMIRRGFTVDGARKICFTIGAAMSALSFALPFVSGDVLAIAIICMMVAGNQWSTVTYIAAVGDIFPSSVVGRVNGIAGVGDSGAGMVTMLLTGIVIDHYSYFPIMMTAGILPLAGLAVIFYMIRRIAPVPMAADAGAQP